MSAASEEHGGPEISLSKCWVVKARGCKKVWLPDIMEKGGKQFIRIGKFCRHFCMFCLGVSMDMRQGKQQSANTASFDQILSLRRDASVKAVEDCLAEAEEGDHPEGRAKKKRVVKKEDQDMLSDPWVIVRAPEVEYEGRMYGPLSMKVIWSLHDPELWIEMNQENLAYLRAMVRADRASEKHGRTRVVKRKSRSSPKRSPKKKRARMQEGAGGSTGDAE